MTKYVEQRAMLSDNSWHGGCMYQQCKAPFLWQVTDIVCVSMRLRVLSRHRQDKLSHLEMDCAVCSASWRMPPAMRLRSCSFPRNWLTLLSLASLAGTDPALEPDPLVSATTLSQSPNGMITVHVSGPCWHSFSLESPGTDSPCSAWHPWQALTPTSVLSPLISA